MGQLSSLTGGGGFTGGAATSTSGAAKGGTFGDFGGISSPVVIGGYKTSGEATATTFPKLSIGLAVGALVAWILYKKFVK